MVKELDTFHTITGFPPVARARIALSITRRIHVDIVERIRRKAREGGGQIRGINEWIARDIICAWRWSRR